MRGPSGRRFTIPAPSTARVPLSLVLRVQARDGFACVYCGTSSPRLHVDHVRPLAHFPAGAPDREVNAPSNLVAACPDCNGAKGPQDGPGFARMLSRRGVPASGVRGMLLRVRRAVRRPV